MERSGVAAVTLTARSKAGCLERSFIRYFIYAMLAGVFCGLGMILAYSSGGALDFYEATRGFAKIVFGLSFALSFTLIVFAGSELFTGDVLVMAIGAFGRAVPLGAALRLLAAVYFGNLCGATLISLLIGATGLLNSEMVGGYIISNTAAKMALPFGQAVARGILCNMLVCLATWACSKLKSEPAKMLILLWSVYGFCTSGYEHSIANMALFVMALVSPLRTAEITLAGYFHNLVPVTLGNLLGGVLVGAVYFYISSQERE
ncbi:MAG: formate/nitrite transporter family protein [Peptococcaceae bacterium]|nr:formate/nitrite transporter family protein [Peptococcaceae bacterium]